MEITKGMVFRIYPTKAQEEKINKTLGCCRYVYNHFLSVRTNIYKETGKGISYYKTSAMLTDLKKELGWLKEADSMALQEALRNLDRSFQNFFEKRANYPTFHSKRSNNQSYRTRNQNNGIRIVGKYINIPKLGHIKFKQTMFIEGSILNATLRRKPSGKYFISLCVKQEIKPLINNGGKIGIDVGIKSFYSDSNGNVIENPKYLNKTLKKVKREQKRLSRKQKGSKNRDKQRLCLARAHEKISNQRNDFLQKQSTILVRENQTICIENLRIRNMLKNHKLARSISDVAWGNFYKMLEYKSVWYGTEIRRIPTFYPSSQTCSNCGYLNKDVKNLTVRKWICPCCSKEHDRDNNASINILIKGLQQSA
ncbi:transposase [Mobilitalea sibirica]|uniref:Transposase n=1 Tax=Mobilitalea sibirica TaxID=1462919 RepID=A0A8J7KXG9_9FIRM|nr:IS200/IS605 family element RNA-guided endonuclease TnpB [Mobilitalea sibirica]MBH1942535.1 transposase [Mobilitalea sibirica]